MVNKVCSISDSANRNRKGVGIVDKAGEIYKSIANECLSAWYPDMADDVRQGIIEHGDLEEIESLIGAQSSIDAAINALQEALGVYQIRLPSYFSDIIYHSGTPNSDVEQLTIEIGRNRAIGERAMTSIALRVLSRIHTRWIKDNVKKYFDENRRDKRYMFLPIEFIGWDEVLKDYIFLRPLLQLLCIRPETYVIQQAYADRQAFYVGKLSTDGRKNIATFEIRENLLLIDQNVSSDEVNEVIEQVMSRCPTLKAK